MLSIYVHNSESPGFLDIPDNAVLAFESITAAFAEEEGYGEFSIPMDLVWTDNNRRTLNFKERLSNYDKSDNFFTCTVYNDHCPELTRAKLTLVNRAGSLRYRNGKFSISISGTRGLFSASAKKKRLKDLDLGVIYFEGMDSREFAYWHYTEGFVQYPQIRFGPVGWEGYFDQERYDYNGEFLEKNTINNVIDLGGGSWTFGRPDISNPSVAVDPTNEKMKDYRTIPFIQLLWLLKKIYTELGFTVSGACFTDGNLDDMVVFNNHSIEKYFQDAFTTFGTWDLNNFIDLKNHVPAMTCYEFLSAVLSGLGIFPDFKDDTNVELVYHKSNVTNTSMVNMDDVLVDDFSSDYTDDLGTQNGYRISYKSDEDDQYYTERVKDITGKTAIATVNTMAELAAISGGGLTTDDMVFVKSENMYYVVADAAGPTVKWDAFAEALYEYKVGNGDKQVEIPFSTLSQYVVRDSTTGLLVNKGYLATRQKGSYRLESGIQVTNSFGLRLFYCSKPGNAAVKPRTYNHNRDADNVKIEPLTFALQETDGLSSLHTDWQNLLQNAEVVKIRFKDNAITRERLKKFKKLQAANVVFFIKKTEPQYPPADTILTELVPL